VFLLTSIKRIVITTSQMPTNREYYSISQEQSTNRTLGILFSVPVNDTVEFNSESIDFVPPSEKLIDMISQEPLNIIDFKISFVSEDGRLFPVYIEPGKAFGVSFAFIHKSIKDNAFTFNQLNL
jgi:hypothetical protein